MLKDYTYITINKVNCILIFPNSGSPQKYNNDDLELSLRIQHKRKKSMQLGIIQEIISKGLH